MTLVKMNLQMPNLLAVMTHLNDWHGNGLNTFSCNVCIKDMVMNNSVNDKPVSIYLWADIYKFQKLNRREWKMLGWNIY